MSSSTNQTEAPVQTVPEQRRLWLAALGYGAAASVATTVVASILHVAGVSLDVKGEPIPVLAFAQVTFMFSLVGLAIAAALGRWTRNPRTAWLRTALVLTACSFIPDLMADAATSTKLTLMTTHVVAAAIVIPGIASRLDR